MDEIGVVVHEEPTLTTFERHKFFFMIGGTIFASLVLVSVAMILYVSSGTELLDLSRPGYQAVSKQAVTNDNTVIFPSGGPLDQAAVKQFQQLYAQESEKVTKVPAFSGDPIGATINPQASTGQ